MGLNFKLAGTNKGGVIVIHKMHIINVTKIAQIVPKCSSLTYCSFKDHSSFINWFLFLDHSSDSLTNHFLLSFIDCSSFSSIDYSSFSFINCSKSSQSLMFTWCS
jgi:hypothetical protein